MGTQLFKSRAFVGSSGGGMRGPGFGPEVVCVCKLDVHLQTSSLGGRDPGMRSRTSFLLCSLTCFALSPFPENKEHHEYDGRCGNRQRDDQNWPTRRNVTES